MPVEPDVAANPPGAPAIYQANDFLDATTLLVGKERFALRHRAQVELAKVCCELGAVGFLKLPVSEEVCRRVLREWEAQAQQMAVEFRGLAAERTDDEDRIAAIVAELVRLI